MPTRATKLASATPAAGVFTTVFTVPAGFTFLVKEVIVYNSTGVADTIFCGALDAAGAQAAIFPTQALASGSRVEWNGLLAMIPTDFFQVQTVGGHASFWIGGTKLPGTA